MKKGVIMDTITIKPENYFGVQAYLGETFGDPEKCKKCSKRTDTTYGSVVLRTTNTSSEEEVPVRVQVLVGRGTGKEIVDKLGVWAGR